MVKALHLQPWEPWLETLCGGPPLWVCAPHVYPSSYSYHKLQVEAACSVGWPSTWVEFEKRSHTVASDPVTSVIGESSWTRRLMEWLAPINSCSVPVLYNLVSCRYQNKSVRQTLFYLITFGSGILLYNASALSWLAALGKYKPAVMVFIERLSHTKTFTADLESITQHAE